MLSPGSHLGPYEVVAPIGPGGMGEVYRARASRLGRDVARKVLPPQHSSDTQRLRRFEPEARAVASLNHPNILGVFDIGSGDGTTWVAFELLEGRTLLLEHMTSLGGGAPSAIIASLSLSPTADGPSAPLRKEDYVDIHIVFFMWTSVARSSCARGVGSARSRELYSNRWATGSSEHGLVRWSRRHVLPTGVCVPLRSTAAAPYPPGKRKLTRASRGRSLAGASYV